MKKHEINILVVDDDNTMLNTISEIVERDGFKAIKVNDPKSAIRSAKVNIIHFAIIDIMLSGMNGVDLACELRKMGVNSPIIFISGIFKDKGFKEKSIQKANAKAFLAKPFNVAELVSIVNENLRSVIEKPKLPLQALLLQEKVSPRDKIKALDRVESLTGLDLIYLLSLLLHSNLKGYLNVLKGKDIFSISFSEGKLIKVDGPHTENLVKDMLVKKEYLSVQDIQVINEKKIYGDFIQGLIEENLISPHILPEIRNFQALMEIKSLVNEDEIEVNFARDRNVDFVHSLDNNLFYHLQSELLEENFELEWFKKFYLLLKNHPIELNKKSDLAYFKLMPIVSCVNGLLDNLSNQPTIGELILSKKYDEDKLFRAIHFLAVNKVILFSEQIRSMSVFADVDRLKSLNEKIQTLNPFEIFIYFGAKKSCPASEVNRLYKEFAKSYHPDKLSSKASTEQKTILHEMFARVTEAHDILIDDKKRNEYVDEIEQNSVEKQLKAESLMEEGIKFLKKSEFDNAKKLFAAASELHKTPRLELYDHWIRLKGIKLGAVPDEYRQQN